MRCTITICFAAWIACLAMKGPCGAQQQQTASGEGSGQEKAPTLAEILLGDVERDMLLSETMPSADQFPRPNLDESKLTSLGLRKLSGKYIRIWTDLPSAPGVDQLATRFDEGVAEWNRYFGLDRELLEQLDLIGYVMGNESTFRDSGLLPRDLPPFLHGYQRGYELWVRDQPSDYYRQHLLLHEGVHAFMNILMGGTGPPWYREGMAEHLATHRIVSDKLQVGVMPESREEVPYWGRIKILQDQFAAGDGKMLSEVMRLGNADFLKNEAYAWSWAAVAYLDGHPNFRASFRQLRRHVNENPLRFTRLLLDQITTRLRQFDEQWQLFIVNIDYGYDFNVEAVKYRIGMPVLMTGSKYRAAVDRGWQSTAIKLSAGKTYRINASGQYQLRQKPEVWWSEPGGVTLTYHRGNPLGALLGSVRLDTPRPGLANLGDPFVIGLRRHIRPANDGTLYVRINDYVGEITDNVGEILVEVNEVRAKR